MPARRAAVTVLTQVHRVGGYSQVVLDNLLRQGTLSPADAALATRLIYGVIERRLTLDYVIKTCATVPIKKMHPQVVEILRVGLYQLLYMDKIPAGAAVNESVKLAKAMGHEKAAGFINGVLRGVDRRRDSLFEQLPAGEEGMEILYSCPRALIQLWKNAYGEETALAILSHIGDIPPTCLRVNTLLISPEEFTKTGEMSGVSFQRHPFLPAFFEVENIPVLKRLANLKENWYYYQDTASQWCCEALGALPGECIADVCAAPGGKSFTLAQTMQNTGHILAGDKHAAKCDTMEQRAKALGITCLRTVARDATKPCPPHLLHRFDRVLCDVPCSGLGAIRRKPEIRYKELSDFDDLPALQYAILEQSATMVRPGGVLQYSTCTLNPAENEQVAQRFLAEHAEFSPRILPLESCFQASHLAPSHTITLFPHVHGTDGFFIAGFSRNEVSV